MKCRHLATPALASAFALALLAQPGFAETAANPPKPETAVAAPAKPSAEAKDLMRFSSDGHNAAREIMAARVAIFNGDPKLAMEMIAQAKASVSKAELEAPTFTLKTTESVQGKAPDSKSQTEKAEMVPVDGQVVLADDFVATPEKQAHVSKANEHFKNGRKKEALEELRLGEIEVHYDRVFMPLASTYKHIEQATKLMDDHKYYEANLALKAIGDSFTVDSVILIDSPKK
jgi:hypothetical protein